MTRIAPLALNRADAATQSTLNAVKAKLGMLPNLISTFAHSPAALTSYLSFSELLGKGTLTARQRETIALAVGQANTCQYCLSAHTVLGKHAGLSEQDIAAARQGRSFDTQDAAIARLAVLIVEKRGQLSDKDLEEARRHAISDSLIIEIVANVVLNIFTNYTNHIADTQIDFPVVSVAA